MIDDDFVTELAETYTDEDVCMGCAAIDLAKEVKRLRDGIRKMHTRWKSEFGAACTHCNYEWPCPTIQLIEGEKTINDETINDESLLIEGEK